MALLWAFVLVACGGGGGSAGSTANPNAPTPTNVPTSSVASLLIATSSDMILNTGAAGSEVTVTVTARDVRNTAVSGATVLVGTNLGVLTPVTTGSSTGSTGSGNTGSGLTTDANGQVVLKLSVPTGTAPTAITLTATAGTLSPTTKTVNVVAAAAKVTLASSAASFTGGSVNLTATVTDAANNIIRGVKVNLSVSSGVLTLNATDGKTNDMGMLGAVLTAGTDQTPRAITVTATVDAMAGASSPSTKTINFSPQATLQIVTSTDSVPVNSTAMITVLARDANNNVLRGAKINMSSDTGVVNVTSANGLTDNNGIFTANLSAGNDATPRNINVTAALDASAGAATPVTRQVSFISSLPKLTITASSGNLVSSGAAGTEVTISVLVRDAGNNVQSGVPVTLTADSGALTVGTRTTNAQGIVTEKLSTGNDPLNRTITVTASTANIAPVSTQVLINTTKIKINAASTVNGSSTAPMTVTLVDSSGTPLPGRTVTVATTSGGTIKTSGGAVVIGSGSSTGTTVTDAGGQVGLVYTPGPGASDTITVSALNSTASQTVTINRSNFYVIGQTNPPSGSNQISTGLINTCYAATVHSDNDGTPTTGTVNLSISRGVIYSDAACSIVANASLTLVNGNATAYFSSNTAGGASLVATLPGGTSVQGPFTFSAPLTPTANITLITDPAVIGTNSNGDQSQQATIRAIVRDGTGANNSINNLVTGAVVNFSILQDSSGGSLLQPSVVTTGADGVATVNYVAGPNPTSLNGVVIQAQIQGTAIANTANLTVAKRALFLTAGTGNKLAQPNNESYQQDYQVLVTDAAGNAVPGVNVTASIRPTRYRKGQMTFLNNFWVPIDPPLYCLNEDLNFNGIYSPSEDTNHNGRLDPGIPVAVTPTVQTSSSGTTTISLIYARNQSYWVEVELTIRATVAGSEATFKSTFVLSGLASDYNVLTTPPPGQVSPYGTVLDCTSQY